MTLSNAEFAYISSNDGALNYQTNSKGLDHDLIQGTCLDGLSNTTKSLSE
jgi:hypothetical protein